MSADTHSLFKKILFHLFFSSWQYTFSFCRASDVTQIWSGFWEKLTQLDLLFQTKWSTLDMPMEMEKNTRNIKVLLEN